MTRTFHTIPTVTLIVLAGSLVLLAVHAASYLPFFADDGFISLRYTDRFLNGRGLTWNDGERVEGYSNLLWVLGCAGLGRLGLDLVVAARMLGFLGAAAAIAAVVWLYRGTSARAVLPGLAGAAALAFSGSLAAWTFGGLEQPLLAGLLAWVLALCHKTLSIRSAGSRQLAVPGLILGLIVLTRSDGAIFTIAICLGIVVARGFNRETLMMATGLAVLPFVFFLAQLAFRLGYYHEWLPNPAYAKVAFTAHRIGTGLIYLGGFVFMAGLLVPALLAPFITARDPTQSRRARFLATVLAVWLAYVVIIGGDVFPGRRHLIPAVVILAFLAALSVKAVISRGNRIALLGLAGAFCFALFGFMQVLDPENIRARKERWEWDGQAIGGLLAQAFGAQRPLLAVDPAGCVPYFSRLPSIDMLGLNDKYLARHRPAMFGKSYLGHELGDGAYVLSRNPDLVLFNQPRGGLKPFFISGRQMVLDTRFSETFQPVRFQCERPHKLLSIVWARTEGGAIGIQRSQSRVVVPGFLFSSDTSSVARLDETGRIGVLVKPDAPALLAGLRLGAGRWVLRPESSGGSIAIGVSETDRGGILATGRDSVSFALPEGGESRVNILILASDASGAHVRAVRLVSGWGEGYPTK